MLTRILLWDDNQSVDVKIEKSDIVLIIGQNIEDCVGWLKLVGGKQNNIPGTIYSQKAGALKYSPIIFAKYLQYKCNAEDVFFNNRKYKDYTGELFAFFELWESLVCLISNNRSLLAKNVLAKLEGLAKKYGFFCEIGKLFYVLEKYLKIVSDNLLFEYFENYDCFENAGVTKMSHPVKEILKKRLSYVKDVNKRVQGLKLDSQIQEFRFEKFSKAFSNLHSFLNAFDNSDYINYLYLLSSYMYFLSDLYFLSGNYTICVQLCHRSVDLYLHYLLKAKHINCDLYLVDKYKCLVKENLIIYDKNISDKVEVLNSCRNRLLLTHGSWRVDKNIASKILKITEEIILSVEEKYSQWGKFRNLIKPLDLERLDLFAFETPVLGFLKLEGA